MTTRRKRCSCGKLQVVCEGEPVRISMCHCLACQRRTGAVQRLDSRLERRRLFVPGLQLVSPRERLPLEIRWRWAERVTAALPRLSIP